MTVDDSNAQEHTDDDYQGDAQPLVARIRQGDEQASYELFQRYARRLAALAKNKINSGMQRRLDPEDVVQSALGSFFVRARDGQFDFNRGDDLWKLLAAITINKIRKKIEFHTAQKRAINREANAPKDSELGIEFWECISKEPSPEEPLVLLEELSRLTDSLTEQHQRILQLRLDGNTIEDIGNQVGCSERTARRVLDKIKDQLHQRQVELIE
jgi:RNA polymerase sigma factor (sigma-70 family)